MAGKNQSQRIKTLDKYFRRGRKLSWEELREIVVDELLLDDISERSIKGDIKEMRDGFMGLEPAPIVNIEGLYSYEREFNLFNSPIQDQETYVLMSALDILDQFPEFEQSEKVREVIDKLKKALDINDDNSTVALDFERVSYPAGAKWISQLLPHVKERNPLLIRYQPFNSDSYQVSVVPLLLKEYNGRWMLIAHELELNQIQNYALDRILDFEEKYIDISSLKIDFDHEDRFRDVVGVTYLEEGPIEITFKCSNYLANYFRTKMLHHSQEELGSDGSFKVYCHPNRELIGKLLSYGEDLIVTSPSSLVKTLKVKVKELGKRYGEV